MSTVQFERPTTLFDPQRAAAFEARFVRALNEGGLLNLMADGEPATSAELAARAGLNERYVREWLGGMTVAGVIDHEPDTMTYCLNSTPEMYTRKFR